MKGILPLLGLAVYFVLAVGDFIFKPEMLFIPASLALTAAVMLGVPLLVRKSLRPAPLPMAGAALSAVILAAVSGSLLYALTPVSLQFYAIVCLVATHISLAILAGVLLRQERA